MTQCNTSISQVAFSLALTGAMAIATGWSHSVEAIAPESASEASLISLRFQPPGDRAPVNTTGGGTRAGVRFKPPGDRAPVNTTGGGTRGGVSFKPPGDNAPTNTTSGGTRGGVGFKPPGDNAPTNTTGGGTRGEVGFQVPGDSAPTNTTGGGTRGEVGFQVPGDSAPTNTTGGGTRSDELTTLVPLVPQNQIGRTSSARPTFLVYVPATAASTVFFSLQDENRKDYYQTTFQISGQGGIVKLTLPNDAPELEMGKNYNWFFAVIEPGDILRPDSRGVSGWVKRVASPSNGSQIASLLPLELATLYGEAGIWYDTVAVLGAAKQARPGDATLASEWNDLLEQVGLEALATQPIAENLGY